jgi:uncharacterized protein (TIGR03435 family)
MPGRAIPRSTNQPNGLSENAIILRDMFGDPRTHATLPARGVKRRLTGLRGVRALVSMVLMSSAGLAQIEDAAAFDIASAKLSEHQVGPDYNNQLVFSPAGLSARNATLRRLVSEAYGVQLRQVIGPNWLDQNEYDIEARAGHSVAREELDRMLRTLLAQRFDLKQHGETREMRVYELVVDRAGPKIQTMNDGGTPKNGGGLRFRGEMHQFADFLSVQLSIPVSDNPSQPAIAGGPMVAVIDKTGLTGTYDFSVDIAPELGSDMLTVWQRALPERLGLRLEARRGQLRVIVIDSAARTPTAN